MPRVTLINSNGVSRSASGGCFGFTGRDGDIGGFGPRSALVSGNGNLKVETYRYHIGEQWAGRDRAVGLLDPIPYLKWLANDSSWSKYFKGYNFPEDRMRSNSIHHYLDIRCDIPGHCVIGAASAARLASHKCSNLIPFFNLCVQAGGDPAIALLVFYALGQTVHSDFNIDDNGKLIPRNTSSQLSITQPPNSSSGMLSLSDDEVMRLDNVTPGLLYSFIKGDFEMQRSDHSEVLYETALSYEQSILLSFQASGRHSNRKNFGDFLLARFHQTLTAPDTHRFSGGMGNSTTIAASRKVPIFTSSLVGWVLQLSAEFRTFGRFLGWRT